MLEHIIFVSRGASNDTALTMRARTWGEILPCECGDFSPVPSNGLSLTCKNRNYLCAWKERICHSGSSLTFQPGFATDPNFDCQTLHTSLHLVGVPIYKKHRNLLIYGALMLFLKAFVKSFVFVSAEREAPEPTLSENIIKLQIIDNHILSTMQSKSKSF